MLKEWRGFGRRPCWTRSELVVVVGKVSIRTGEEGGGKEGREGKRELGTPLSSPS